MIVMASPGEDFPGETPPQGAVAQEPPKVVPTAAQIEKSGEM